MRWLLMALVAIGCGDDAAMATGGAGGGGGTAGAGGSGGSGGTGGATSCGDPAALIPSWVTSFQPAQDVYVAPGGDDANPGTAQSPLKTTQAAVAHLAPGVRLDFAAGTYGCAQIANFAGTAAAPGMIRSSDGPLAAKFDCGGSGSILMSQVRYLIFDGIELSNTSGHGIQLDSGAGPWTPGSLSGNIAILHSYIHDTGYASIKMSQSEFIWVIGNKLARAGTVAAGRQLVEFVAVDDTVVAGNEGTDNGGAFNEVKGGAKRALIYRNYVHDTGNANGGGILVGGDCTGQQFLVDSSATYEAENVQVFDNVIVSENQEAFRIVSCHDCVVANNTFFTAGAAGAVMRIIDSGFASPGGSGCDIPTHNQNLTIRNNLFAAASFGYGIASNATSVQGLVMDHNGWIGTAGIASDLPYANEPASLYDVDPALVSPPADPRPRASSPLVHAGVAVSGVTGNADGACWSGAPDIGAY